MSTDTRYAIVGSGNIGSALARFCAEAQVEVVIANTRGPLIINQLAASADPSVLFGDPSRGPGADVIFLAIPFPQ